MLSTRPVSVLIAELNDLLCKVSLDDAAWLGRRAREGVLADLASDRVRLLVSVLRVTKAHVLRISCTAGEITGWGRGSLNGYALCLDVPVATVTRHAVFCNGVAGLTVDDCTALTGGRLRLAALVRTQPYERRVPEEGAVVSVSRDDRRRIKGDHPWAGMHYPPRLAIPGSRYR